MENHKKRILMGHVILKHMFINHMHGYRFVHIKQEACPHGLVHFFFPKNCSKRHNLKGKEIFIWKQRAPLNYS